ncbi:MAG: YchJ family protein [Gammaproteobacteria bacterium]|nr:YchJ family protein [Gammaproteobacteria bacterium]
MQETTSCFCGSNRNFSSCCQPFLNQEEIPTTAEELMRSRYSAFNTGNVDYLVGTLLPEKRMENDRPQIQNTIDNIQWLGLKIIAESNRPGNEVEFMAFFEEENGGTGQLHERSSFIQQNGKWYYVDGVHLPAVKPGRNDLCFCGSGKKFKACHYSR